MVQIIEKNDLFGGIGKGFAQGLSEQLPKEVAHQRLSKGLKALSQKKGLTPLQQLTELISISPEVIERPQFIQSFSELAKQQALRDAYQNLPTGSEGSTRQQRQQNTRDLQNVQFAQQPGQIQRGNQIPQVGEVENLQRTPNVSSKQEMPQVIPGNVLNEQNLTRLPWTPQERNASYNNYISKGFLPEEAKNLQANDEARDLAEPAAHRERLQEIDEAKTKIRDSLKRHLETKLQKTGTDLYKDVEGPMILNAERGMERDLILNPKADIDNVANDWSERLRETALAKGRMKTFGKTTGIENLIKGEKSQKRIKEYHDIFKKSGNLEEMKNILMGPEFGMSPQAAASEAFPVNNKIDKYISNHKYHPGSSKNPSVNANQASQQARRAALEIEKDIGPDDSVLSIMKKFSDKNPFFDKQSFLDQISEDKDQIGLNARQREELAEGVGNILPNWADLLYLPIFRR